MTFYTPGDVSYGLPNKKKEEVVVDPLMTLINRPEVHNDTEDMRNCKELGSTYWNFFMKKLLQNTNVSRESIKDAGRFVLLKEPTDDYMTRLDLIDVDPSLFKTFSNIHLSETELE